MSRRTVLHPARHVHCCQDCGREFYICSDRDCDLAPDLCQGCELDRLDAYFTQPPLPLHTQEPPREH